MGAAVAMRRSSTLFPLPVSTSRRFSGLMSVTRTTWGVIIKTDFVVLNLALLRTEEVFENRHLTQERCAANRQEVLLL